ncbi:hypothetical protein HDV00_006573 [Rhizophlyctis rosea]|nr:hypothetical protein HDV00_006573 [Rhizophlyctis rosea]
MATSEKASSSQKAASDLSAVSPEHHQTLSTTTIELKEEPSTATAPDRSPDKTPPPDHQPTDNTTPPNWTPPPRKIIYLSDQLQAIVDKTRKELGSDEAVAAYVEKFIELNEGYASSEED